MMPSSSSEVPCEALSMQRQFPSSLQEGILRGTYEHHINIPEILVEESHQRPLAPLEYSIQRYCGKPQIQYNCNVPETAWENSSASSSLAGKRQLSLSRSTDRLGSSIKVSLRHPFHEESLRVLRCTSRRDDALSEHPSVAVRWESPTLDVLSRRHLPEAAPLYSSMAASDENRVNGYTEYAAARTVLPSMCKCNLEEGKWSSARTPLCTDDLRMVSGADSGRSSYARWIKEADGETGLTENSSCATATCTNSTISEPCRKRYCSWKRSGGAALRGPLIMARGTVVSEAPTWTDSGKRHRKCADPVGTSFLVPSPPPLSPDKARQQIHQQQYLQRQWKQHEEEALQAHLHHDEEYDLHLSQMVGGSLLPSSLPLSTRAGEGPFPSHPRRCVSDTREPCVAFLHDELELAPSLKDQSTPTTAVSGKHCRTRNRGFSASRADMESICTHQPRVLATGDSIPPPASQQPSSLRSPMKMERAGVLLPRSQSRRPPHPRPKASKSCTTSPRLGASTPTASVSPLSSSLRRKTAIEILYGISNPALLMRPDMKELAYTVPYVRNARGRYHTIGDATGKSVDSCTGCIPHETASSESRNDTHVLMCPMLCSRPHRGIDEAASRRDEEKEPSPCRDVPFPHLEDDGLSLRRAPDSFKSLSVCPLMMDLPVFIKLNSSVLNEADVARETSQPQSIPCKAQSSGLPEELLSAPMPPPHLGNFSGRSAPKPMESVPSSQRLRLPYLSVCCEVDAAH